MFKRNGALAIAVLYTLSGILWIALSDRAVFFLYGPNQSALIHSVSSFKGFAYVTITGILLYLLIKRHNRYAILYQKKMQHSNEELSLLNKALNEQKKLLSDVQTIARFGGWEYYPATQKMVRSDEIYYILDFAYPAEEEPMQNLINHIHPDDKEEFIGLKREIETLGTDVDTVFRIINDNGQLKYIRMAAEADMRNGVPNRIKGSFQDITASKQKDLQLQRALERYDLIARATNDMFYEYDMVNNTLTYSGDFDTITNPVFRNEKDPTKAWFAIVHPDDIAGLIEANQKTIRERKHIYNHEYRVDFGANDYRYVCDQVYIQYENDQPVRMLGAIRDINNLKKTAEEYKRLSDVISMVHNMVLITDTERRIQWVNRAFEQVSGYTLEELKNNLPQLLIGGSSVNPAVVTEIRERSGRQETFYMELPFYSRNGKLTWTYADFTPLYNETQEYIGYTTVYVDISMLKEKEASLLNQNTTLREIAWLESHEMRRPLSSILGLVELIRISNDEAEKKELFELLDICAKEMDSMVLKISKKIQEGMKK